MLAVVTQFLHCVCHISVAEFVNPCGTQDSPSGISQTLLVLGLLVGSHWIQLFDFLQQAFSWKELIPHVTHFKGVIETASYNSIVKDN